jgi:hypothetical protein
MTAAALTWPRGISFLFIVAQQSAGGLVDEVDPAARRAGHGLVGIRRIGRRRFRHLNLNIHAGPCAAIYQFTHASILLQQGFFALISLKLSRASRRVDGARAQRLPEQGLPKDEVAYG